MSESKLSKEIQLGKLRTAATHLSTDKADIFYFGNPNQAELQQRTGQIITSVETEAIEAKVVLAEVLGLARPAYVLRNICRMIRMNSLVASIDVAIAYTGREKVPDMVEAEISRQDYSRQDFDLYKNVVHIVVSDEARLKAAHDVMDLNTRDASAELARMENTQIQAIAESATGVSGSDWGTGTNNPYDNIGEAMDAIEEAGYPVDFIAGHPRMWLDFFSNPFVKGTTQAVSIPQGTAFPINGLPNVMGYSDRSLTSTIALVGSARAPALVLGEGPTESALYRNEVAGYSAYVIRQWLQPKLVIADAIRKITGVHA